MPRLTSSIQILWHGIYDLRLQRMKKKWSKLLNITESNGWNETWEVISGHTENVPGKWKCM